MMNRMKMLIGVPVAAAAIVAALSLQAANYASDTNICKTDPSQLDVDFQVKQPDTASLPEGYSLKAVEDISNTVALYYTDHEICPNLGIDDQLQEGSIVMLTGPISWASSSEEMQRISMENFAKDPELQAEPQPIEINGFKGYG